MSTLGEHTQRQITESPLQSYAPKDQAWHYLRHMHLHMHAHTHTQYTFVSPLGLCRKCHVLHNLTVGTNKHNKIERDELRKGGGGVRESSGIQGFSVGASEAIVGRFSCDYLHPLILCLSLISRLAGNYFPLHTA